MARPLRIQEPGLIYHIHSRGNDRRPMFVDDDDRIWFRNLLADVVDRFRIECAAECQMTTHYHVVFRTEEPNLSRAMQKLNGEYAQWFNARHRRKGHFFEGRFSAQVIEFDAYFLTACRYVVRNPVEAGMVASPEDWPWSSYRASVGMAPIPPYLSLWRLWAQFDADPDVAMQCYGLFVMCARPDALPSDLVLGNRTFAARFAGPARSASAEVTRRHRNVERVTVEELFAGVLTREQRDLAIVRAYREGFKLCDVARLLGLHYSTISKVLKRCQTVKNAAIQDLTPDLSGRARRGGRRCG